jgi:hypothetical protein
MNIMRLTTVLWFLAGCLAILPGCASFDGRGLVAGKSTGTEIVALMGPPAMRIKSSDGDEILYFPRYPEGRVCYAVTIGRDGVMKGIEQRLNRTNFAKILVDKSTRDQVQELIGPPHHILHMRFKGSDVWEYPWFEFDDKRSLFVEFSAAGVVLRVDNVHDQVADKPSLE